MSKIYIQGTFGAYSHLAALEIEPNAEVIPCKTFDECFVKTSFISFKLVPGCPNKLCSIFCFYSA